MSLDDDDTANSLLMTRSIQAPPFHLETFLKKHLRFTKKRVKYHRDELTALCLHAQFELQKNNSGLVEIPYIPIYVVGDIHGQWRDLLRIFSVLGVPGKARYLFLGDYVDRGRRSLECICLLLALKIKYPTKIYLLRGNHECDYINYSYGFYEEIKRRFNLGDTLTVFKAFNNLFSYFPLSALLVDKILCMHGGLSPKLNTLEQLRRIRLPCKVAHNDLLNLDLLWADPKSNLKGYLPNDMRECSYFFGADAVVKTCERLKLDMILRGHQALKNGFGFFAKRHLATIFSAPRYLMPDSNNFGAVFKISRNYELSVIIFNPVTPETQGKFAEIFEENRLSSKTTDEVTKIERMPAVVISASQMGQAP